MIQTSSDDADWVHRKSAVGLEDHTLLGKCKGQHCHFKTSPVSDCLNFFLLDFVDAGYFMHFNTMVGKPQESALLESRTLYPKRKLQCLQFFYKMTGSPKDKLVIWVKMDDGTGSVRKMKKIQTFSGTLLLMMTCIWSKLYFLLLSDSKSPV